jgi:hypothetical protein
MMKGWFINKNQTDVVLDPFVFPCVGMDSAQNPSKSEWTR